MAAMALKRRSPNLGALPTAPIMIDSSLPSTPSIYSTTKTLTNPPAPAGGSLYHTCRAVLDQLKSVPGMEDILALPPTTPTTEPTTPTAGLQGGDPLTRLWQLCRRGSPLCILYNALQPAKPLNVDQDPTLNQLNICKASVYHFIVACRQELAFPEDEMFTISDLYQDDTNGFVKVVNTIQRILNILDDRGIITVKSLDDGNDADGPKDTRDKVVMELLETERKYVQDLEILQNYMRELHVQKVLPPDTIHYLFGNLNSLVDFQRRFLIQLEEMAEMTAEEQRFDALFLQNEEAFSVYEPYCANYYSAQDLVVQETPKLQKLEHILNPIYQLPSMLIKPVQRICKYPLLMSELIKSTNREWAHVSEMEQGLEAIKRVTEKVNETQRQHENIQAVVDLKKKVEDWKSINIDNYGSLLLQEKLSMTNGDYTKDLHAFFFERALLFCKENRDSSRNRLTKSNTLSIKKKRAGSLQPKYLILISRVITVHNTSQQGVWTLNVDYKDREVERMTLRFRNEEQLKLWETTLNKITASNKSNVPNTHLMSMPLNQGDNISYLDDEDDEEDEFDEDEDDQEIHPSRSRSNSVSAQLHHARSKVGLNGEKISPRAYATTPGMNLSPLPRNSSTQSSPTAGPANTTDPTVDHGFYPASPPNSKPASPTTPRSHHPHLHQHHPSPLWQQRHASTAGHEDYPSMNDDTPKGRSYSQSSASYASNLPPTRVRSQSSPNIHKNSSQPQWEDLPQMPINSRTYYSNPSHPTSPTLAAQQQQSPPLGSVVTNGDTLKVKLSYNDGIYVVVCPLDIRFAELMDKVEKKIKLVANLQPNDVLRLKYQDEDEDFITINSDDDVQMAFESRGANTTVNLFVSH
ncbi:hypothetical protein DM01DRAFT_1332728 [Hesseltinella vesiculosa]|uniref:RhoGEF-domain-containing protein n=1 Tax=Hesseltinella vesiculosa TaxID=101127 RepID=A0A1X2GT05_9FUNG|nr:hypothetical protein DM01DRAFT_1332728 [Hesseltinella vesiculosa]